mgnify:FL=1
MKKPILLRLPADLHESLVKQADEADLSLNQFIINKLKDQDEIASLWEAMETHSQVVNDLATALDAANERIERLEKMLVRVERKAFDLPPDVKLGEPNQTTP